MQDGCKVYMDSYVASNGSCFMVTYLDLFSKTTLGGRPNIKVGDHGTPLLTTIGLFYFIMCENPHE